MTTSNIIQDVIVVTPQLAKLWLDESEGANFRPINQASLQRINRLVEVIKAGGWKLDGNPIKFNSQGLLIDGQHRLTAIYKSGIPCIATRIQGIENDLTIDTGKPRTFADYLRHRGETAYYRLEAILGAVWRYRRNPAAMANANSSTKASNDELLKLLETEPTIRESLALCQKAHEIISPTYLGALHHIAKAYNAEAANKFVEKIISGADLLPTDPILHLRNRLLAEKAARKHASKAEILALLIKTWNFWIQGKEIKMLKFSGVGPNAEEFPSIYLGK